MLRLPFLHLECVGCCLWEGVAAPLHSREQQKSISDVILNSLLTPKSDFCLPCRYQEH